MYNDSRAIMSSYLQWKKNKSKCSYLELYCPNTPFCGNFGFVAGVDEIIDFLSGFKFTESEVSWLSNEFGFDCEYVKDLKSFNLSDVKVFGLNNGDLYYKDQPIMILQGPMYKIKLLEFPICNLLGFSGLVCTNALRMRIHAGKDMGMLEFGLRRAQGPLAGLTASKYAHLGDFDGTI
jgi:nicotinate phosphoribosyltransferase